MPGNRLANANQTARCRHVKVNGTPCGSPARRNREFVLPIVEDAASLQLALNNIMQALVDKLIDQKTATTLLYALQIAFANLKQLKGEQRSDEFARALHAQYGREEEDKPEAEPKLPEPGDQVSAGPNRQSSICNLQSSIAPSPDHPIADRRFEIKACADTVPQGRTLVAQDGSPGNHRPERSESRRDGTGGHISPHDFYRQSAIVNGLAIDHRLSTIDSPAVFLDVSPKNSSNHPHAC